MKLHLLLGHKVFWPLAMASWLALCPSTLQYPLAPCLHLWPAPFFSSPTKQIPHPIYQLIGLLPVGRLVTTLLGPWFRRCHSLYLQAALASRKPHAMFQSPHPPLSKGHIPSKDLPAPLLLWPAQPHPQLVCPQHCSPATTNSFASSKHSAGALPCTPSVPSLPNAFQQI